MYEYCKLIGLPEEAHTEKNELLSEEIYGVNTILDEILHSENISLSSIYLGITLIRDSVDKIKKEVFSNNE